MPCTIVVGGQYGSEGKGKIVGHLTRTEDIAAVVRSGGPNAGHTIDWNGIKHVSRCLPSGYTNPSTKLVVSAGGLVDPKVLKEELFKLEGRGYKIRDRLFIDQCAGVVDMGMAHEEKVQGFSDAFGSTQTGTGMAQATKVLRDHRKLKLARDESSLEGMVVESTAEILNGMIDVGQYVIIEGTQGFGLSLNQSGHWPYATSRDTTSAAFAADCGIAPKLITRTIMVIRTYPIRVGGNSGPITEEIKWGDVHEAAGIPEHLRFEEMTSVTQKVRRVGQFDHELMRRAVMVNRPDFLAVHGIDYLDYRCVGARHWTDLSQKIQDWVIDLSERHGIPIRWLYTGPGDANLIDMWSEDEIIGSYSGTKEETDGK